MGKIRGLSVSVFAASTSVEDDHEFARELGQRLGSGRYTAEELRAFVRAARYYQAIDVLQRKTVRADASGRKPKIDIQHLLIDLAEVLAEKHHKPVRKVLGSICGGSDERQADFGYAPPELERIARAVLELAGTPVEDSLVQQARAFVGPAKTPVDDSFVQQATAVLKLANVPVEGGLVQLAKEVLELVKAPVEGSLVQQARAAADLVDCGTLEYRNPSPILPPTPFSTHEPSHFMELDHATCIISRRLRPPAPNPGGPADFPFDALALGEERQVPPTG